MPEKWKIQEAQERTISTTECWEVALLKTDGTIHRHIMPKAALDFRAAEYGIDPADTDTLLEIILHEPHLSVVDDPTSGPRYADAGPDLWQADTTQAARAAHLARVKASPIRIDIAGAKALDTIRANHRPDTARIRAIREVVDTSRWVQKYGDLPAKPIDPMEAVRA